MTPENNIQPAEPPHDVSISPSKGQNLNASKKGFIDDRLKKLFVEEYIFTEALQDTGTPSCF